MILHHHRGIHLNGVEQLEIGCTLKEAPLTTMLQSLHVAYLKVHWWGHELNTFLSDFFSFFDLIHKHPSWHASVLPWKSNYLLHAENPHLLWNHNDVLSLCQSLLMSLTPAYKQTKQTVYTPFPMAKLWMWQILWLNKIVWELWQEQDKEVNLRNFFCHSLHNLFV